MGSRLLARLQARIAEARDPVRSACLRAQRAVHLARQGSHDEAQAEVRALRAAFAERPNAEVTAWISLAEAVDSFYRHPGPQALDRLKRAQALARAIGHAELQPLCAAWLAHLEFNANRMESMVQHAAEALRLARPEHHAALARVSLVEADAYHFAGRFDLAKPWYAAVREHALADGDDAMISAMLHNVAALRVNRVYLADAFGEDFSTELRRAQIEAESVEAYDFGIGTLSLQSFVPLIRAQLLSVQRRFSDVLLILDSLLDGKGEDLLARREAQFLAERAWCHANLGIKDRALIDLERAQQCLAASSDADDTAAAYSRVASVSELLGNASGSADARVRAIEALQRHRGDQEALLRLLVEGFGDQGNACPS
jgi:tetratricopeptide (TPR) repeat protein